MSDLKFEWDDNKYRSNVKKHGITFEEAATVFLDERGIVFDDPDHSIDEERFLILGESTSANLLIVCHCVRGLGETIRIISARKATGNEAVQYREINEGW